MQLHKGKCHLRFHKIHIEHALVLGINFTAVGKGEFVLDQFIGFLAHIDFAGFTVLF